jgi:hypothetical protein
MSTKCTLAYGDDFHFYTDYMDEGFVHLEVEPKCSCGSFHNMRIPLHIWETIRKCPGMSFELAELSDDDISAKVTKEVDERIAEFKTAENKRNTSLIRFYGSGVFGDAKDSRENQIKSGIEYYTKDREYQRHILNLAKEHKVYAK